jgi:2-polyprenyl-3-methyl-5-hydroxy-6-metoxy-1,4-benzoquinol methylase
MPPLLGERFRNNGVPTVQLNALELEMKKIVDDKVSSGAYGFEDIPCPVCGGSDFTLLSEKDRYGLRMPVSACKTCGFVLTNPRMTQKAYNEFYNFEYRKLYGGRPGPDESFYAMQLSKGAEIYSYLKKESVIDKRPAKMFILEVGCGAGGILGFFKDKGARVKGIDLGDEYVRYGREKHGLDLETCPLPELKLEERPDLIIYHHVFEHVLDPAAELKTIREICGPGTVLFIALPGIYDVHEPNNRYGADFLVYLQNAHVWHFTLKSLSDLMEKHGFKLIRGNELIQSAFRKTDEFRTVFENDYNSVTDYLQKLNTLRELVADCARMKKPQQL